MTVEFSEATDLNVAASDARNSIGRVLSQLPDDADEPRIVKADANSDPVDAPRGHLARRCRSRR